MNEKKERKKYLGKSNIHKLLLNMIKPLMLCPSNMRVISSKHSLTLFLQYALLTYGNMPVHPRFRVKLLLKC